MRLEHRPLLDVQLEIGGGVLELRARLERAVEVDAVRARARPAARRRRRRCSCAQLVLVGHRARGRARAEERAAEARALLVGPVDEPHGDRRRRPPRRSAAAPRARRRRSARRRASRRSAPSRCARRSAASRSERRGSVHHWLPASSTSHSSGTRRACRPASPAPAPRCPSRRRAGRRPRRRSAPAARGARRRCGSGRACAVASQRGCRDERRAVLRHAERRKISRAVDALTVESYRPIFESYVAMLGEECYEAVRLEPELTWEERKIAQNRRLYDEHPDWLWVLDEDGDIFGFVSFWLLPEKSYGHIDNNGVPRRSSRTGLGDVHVPPRPRPLPPGGPALRARRHRPRRRAHPRAARLRGDRLRPARCRRSITGRTCLCGNPGSTLALDVRTDQGRTGRDRRRRLRRRRLRRGRDASR